ncbi:MAG: hypothetical protein GX780_04340 [Campylobacteraceae bacterium]|nr:hypothetical protein [Campylobacteraceae bacterium]
MFKNSLLGVIFGLFVLTGCGYKESVVQNSDSAYLQFNRNSHEQFTVYINNSSQIQLPQCVHEEVCNKDTRYEIPSGTVLIKVFDKSNKQVHQEQLYLGVGNIKKIILP